MLNWPRCIREYKRIFRLKKGDEKIISLFAYIILGDKMYAAILNKKLVLAINEAEQVNNGFKKLNQDYYTCPSCRKRMILIISEEKLPFFKHFYQVKGTGEKEEHDVTIKDGYAVFTTDHFSIYTLAEKKSKTYKKRGV